MSLRIEDDVSEGGLREEGTSLRNLVIRDVDDGRDGGAEESMLVDGAAGGVGEEEEVGWGVEFGGDGGAA